MSLARGFAKVQQIWGEFGVSRFCEHHSLSRWDRTFRCGKQQRSDGFLPYASFRVDGRRGDVQPNKGVNLQRMAVVKRHYRGENISIPFVVCE
jgi:hypothetical protein